MIVGSVKRSNVKQFLKIATITCPLRGRMKSAQYGRRNLKTVVVSLAIQGWIILSHSTPLFILTKRTAGDEVLKAVKGFFFHFYYLCLFNELVSNH